MEEKYAVAIVEDEGKMAELLGGFFERFSAETGVLFEVNRFEDGESFLKDYGAGYDLVLMDIELPGINGMETVRRLRQTDHNVIVIFVTNLAQYAVKGYEVEAFDFIVKPVTYYNFCMRLRRAMQRFESRKETEVWVNIVGQGKQKLKTSAIKYVEVMDHKLVFHTTDGDYVSNGSMQSAQKLLKDAPFALCNRCYLVNLAFVTGTRQYEVNVGGDALQISHLKRNEFLRRLNVYLSGGGLLGDD